MTWKLSMPQLVQKAWNHSAGEKTCQVFVSCAVLEGIFLCISKAIYFVSTAESMLVWWVVDDILKKGWRRWCYIQMKPLKNITKLFCEVFLAKMFTQKDVYIIRIIRWWVRVPVDYQEFGNKIRALYIHLLRINGLVNGGGPENLGFEAHDTCI